ncbi:putative multiple sugar transport system permease protein [Curtobacterium sp. PhB172]|uniref:ABC transporter permease subunit n=1 Tax=unclassified Curtobacterium TaxID=257496 RepID=UPI000F493D13|nr:MULTISPECIES: sugar ABC transporter permease [unclassified Curtobacterium]ROQ17771.1 putative multiple sugar transport system permease protein [Curtobacterium sp. PhB171]ROQ28984.1 putative multiple sugar transport system permease protein [Curtobacterium sp. PhB170]ROS45872.1 putative multiple sugar transport system permease protein [Curtobacterium sp. PhB131]ROS65425.1 putative multiple sugar transport system permease protein [Curtobacterium sp. PhB172]ROS67826.1 putative multiple sugar tr
MNNLKLLFGKGNSIGQYGMIIALIVLLAYFAITTQGLILEPTNVINLFLQYSYILILALGMVMVIIAGHIDLSVGSVAAVVGIIVAQSIAVWNFPVWAAILLGLVVGAVIGAWQGFWVAFVRVPAFIVTLAGQLIFRGVNQIIGNSTSVPVPDSFTPIGAGFLGDFGPDFGYSNGTLLLGLATIAALIIIEARGRARRRKMQAEVPPLWVSVVRTGILVAVTLVATYLFGAGPVGTSVPIVAIILGVLTIVYGFVTKNTIFGRQVYAVGGNSSAAVLSGVSAKKVNFFVMMNMSVLAAVAGMVFVAYSGASGPADGTGWELDAIAAVFVGGAAVAGGVGTISGSIIGGLVMALLSNGLQLMGLESNKVQIIRGLVLLVAVAFDVYSKSQGRPSLIGGMMRQFQRKDTEQNTVAAQQPRSIEDQPDKITLP